MVKKRPRPKTPPRTEADPSPVVVTRVPPEVMNAARRLQRNTPGRTRIRVLDASSVIVENLP